MSDPAPYSPEDLREVARSGVRHRLRLVVEGGGDVLAALDRTREDLVRIDGWAPAPAPAPTPDPGFTPLPPSPDTRVIYVSSDGDDTADGLSPDTAVRTPERGYELLRDGQPDWLLFRAGDTFRGGLPYWRKSGRSEAERMVVGVWGEGDRPRFMTEGRSFLSVHTGGFRHVAIVGLHAVASHRDPTGPDFQGGRTGETGVRIVGAAVEDLILEDCRFEFFADGIVLQGAEGVSPPQITGVQVRRNIIRFCYRPRTAGHSQGIFITRARGVLVEENLFDHNGFNPGVEGAELTKFNHSMYLHQESGDLTVRGNIVARGDGLQLRPGGVVDGNVFWRVASAAWAARSDSSFTGNLVLAGTDHADGPLGDGLRAWDMSRSVFTDNIVAHRESERQTAGIEAGGDRSVVRGNIVYRWHNRRGEGIEFRAETGEMEGNLVGNDPSLYVDPNRSLDTWAGRLGMTSAEGFLEAAGSRARGTWPAELAAPAIIAHVREGFRRR